MLTRVAGDIVKTILFTVFVPGAVAVYIPYRLRGSAFHIASLAETLGIVPIVAGLLLYLWCAWDFAVFGHGTPLPLDAPKRLVVRGPYRFVRNPMYVAVFLAIDGQALWFGSLTLLWYALAVAAFFHLFVVLYEEPALRRQFGDSYERYRSQVHRWLPTPAAKRAQAR